MTIESDGLANLRETTSKILLAVLCLHIPIAVCIGVMRGASWLVPAAFMLTMAVAAMVFLPVAARAQVGSTTDIITGKVNGPPPGNQPIVGATVIVTSIDTHISRQRITNADGRYTVVFPDGGGEYRVEIRAIGFTPSEALIQRQADEDRLVANIQLTSAVHTLATVTTTDQGSRGSVPISRPWTTPSTQPA